ncbi:MAG: hypothetical protein ACTHJ1_18950 [Bordetella sp.]
MRNQMRRRANATIASLEPRLTPESAGGLILVKISADFDADLHPAGHSGSEMKKPSCEGFDMQCGYSKITAG